MKKLMIILLVTAMVSGFLFGAYKLYIIPEEKIVIDIDKEYEEYLAIINGEQIEESFSDRMEEYVTIEYPFFSTRFSDELECEVTYPDLKSYWLENQDELVKLDQESLSERLLMACETCSRKTASLTFPAEYDNGFLLLDSDSFEYQNCITGGMLELAAELYSEAVNEILAEVE